MISLSARCQQQQRGTCGGLAPAGPQRRSVASACQRQRLVGAAAGAARPRAADAAAPRAAASSSSLSAGAASAPTPTPTKKPVVVFAIDDTEAAAQALEWAAAALCPGGDADRRERLRLLHVVCDDRAAATSIGVTPTGRVRRDAADLADRRSPAVREHEARLVAKARLMVERRCKSAGVGVLLEAEAKAAAAAAARQGQGQGQQDAADDDEPRILLPVAPGAKSAYMIGAAVCRSARAVGPGAALVVPSHGPGALADFGSVARFCYQRALATSSAQGGTTRAAGDCSALVLVPPARARELAASRRVALAARSDAELQAVAAWAAGPGGVLRPGGGDEVVVIRVDKEGAAGAGAGGSASALPAAVVKAAVAVVPPGEIGWQQRVLDAAGGARCLVMLEEERVDGGGVVGGGGGAAAGAREQTFEQKMAALVGGAVGATMDDGDLVGGGGDGALEQGLADYASRHASVPLVLVRR
jgi:hypothetical protein